LPVGCGVVGVCLPGLWRRLGKGSRRLSGEAEEGEFFSGGAAGVAAFLGDGCFPRGARERGQEGRDARGGREKGGMGGGWAGGGRECGG